jgi:hypothetical protein
MERECACCQFSFEIACDFHFSVLSRGNVQCLNHPTSRSIRVSAAFHLLPEFAPVRIRQQVFLPLAVQKRSGLLAKTFDDRAIVDAPRPSNCSTPMHMNAREFDNLGGADKAHNSVMVKM